MLIAQIVGGTRQVGRAIDERAVQVEQQDLGVAPHGAARQASR